MEIWRLCKIEQNLYIDQAETDIALFTLRRMFSELPMSLSGLWRPKKTLNSHRILYGYLFVESFFTWFAVPGRNTRIVIVKVDKILRRHRRPWASTISFSGTTDMIISINRWWWMIVSYGSAGSYFLLRKKKKNRRHKYGFLWKMRLGEYHICLSFFRSNVHN